MTDELDGPLQTCVTCNASGTGNPATWHKRQHPFRSAAMARDGVGWKTAPDAPQTDNATARPPAYPFDPVLRQALIDKGVLTPDDLTNAQAKIEIISGIFNSATKQMVGLFEREADDDGTTAPAGGE